MSAPMLACDGVHSLSHTCIESDGQMLRKAGGNTGSTGVPGTVREVRRP